MSGTTDTVTALTNLGAREYNTGTGTFTSPDPLLTPYNPQDLNPYAYASDNPATSSDPTGLCIKSDPGDPPLDCKGNPVGGGGNGSGNNSSGNSGGRTSPAPGSGTNLGPVTVPGSHPQLEHTYEHR
jgi:RHS repeat-associated protein